MGVLMSEHRNLFINTARTIELGNTSWELAQESGLTDRSVVHCPSNRLRDQDGHVFMNMGSCSCLGLETDERVCSERRWISKFKDGTTLYLGPYGDFEVGAKRPAPPPQE